MKWPWNSPTPKWRRKNRVLRFSATYLMDDLPTIFFLHHLRFYNTSVTWKITAHTKTDAKTAVSIYFKINRREKDFYFVCLQCNIRRLIHWHGHYVPKHNVFCFLRLWTYQQNLLFCVNCGCVSIIRVVTGSCHWFFLIN